jgi:quercetin dioxygenase-like cupin family protein
VHPDRTEAFWVLDGEAEFELDGQTTRGAAGSFVLVPGGAAHTFGATPDAAARLLVLPPLPSMTTSGSWPGCGLPRIPPPMSRNWI